MNTNLKKNCAFVNYLDKRFAKNILKSGFCRAGTPDHDALIEVAGCNDFFVSGYAYLRFYHVWQRFRNIQKQMKQHEKGESIQLKMTI